jgi:hypothetical protein
VNFLGQFSLLQPELGSCLLRQANHTFCSKVYCTIDSSLETGFALALPLLTLYSVMFSHAQDLIRLAAHGLLSLAYGPVSGTSLLLNSPVLLACMLCVIKCFLCNEWFMGEDAWDTHCQDHVHELESLPAFLDPLIFDGVLAIASFASRLPYK